MVGQSRNDRVVQVQNLADYFRTSIDGVISRQGVDVDPHAAHYVVNLLTLFSRSEELYEDHGESYGLRPLALMMADAAEAQTAAARNYALQRIGDVAVVVHVEVDPGSTGGGRQLVGGALAAATMPAAQCFLSDSRPRRAVVDFATPLARRAGEDAR